MPECRLRLVWPRREAEDTTSSDATSDIGQHPDYERVLAAVQALDARMRAERATPTAVVDSHDGDKPETT